MKKQPLLIAVKFNGEQIGTMTPTEFRKAVEPSFGSRKFLNALVAEFNASKAHRGEPERVEIVLNK